MFAEASSALCVQGMIFSCHSAEFISAMIAFIPAVEPFISAVMLTGRMEKTDPGAA